MLSNFVDRFCAAADGQSETYRSGVPFPHIALDNLFDQDDLQELLEEFPAPEDPIWQRTENKGIQVKLRTNWQSDRDIRPRAKSIIDTLNSGDVLRSLAKLTGIEGLIADPYLTGGGLNCILPGGQLAVHCDGNWHDLMRVHRRLNLIVFLNQDWNIDWGGQFELWDRNLTQCEKKIEPWFNRLLVFTTNDFTYHGHPIPLACPPGRSRKSLILYYYTSYPRETSEVASEGMHRAQWKVEHDGTQYNRVKA